MPLCSLLPPGNAVALVTHVLIDTTHVRVATAVSNGDAVVCSHTHTYTHDVVFPITSQILEPIHTPLHVRVVGDQEAIHVLIRVRHRSRSSPRIFLSLCVSHNDAEFLQTTLGLVLRLVDLVLVSGLLCLLHHPINFGLSDTLADRGLDAVVCGL